MKVRELIAQLIKCNMNATVIISIENESDTPYIEDEACSVTDLFNEVVISNE